MPHGTCSIDSISSVFDDRYANGAIKMFMCKWCNYIQVHRMRMVQHMREHSQIDTNFNKNVDKLIFIPNVRPLTWNLSVNYQFVPESARFRCAIDKCGMCFSNSNDFERHFNENHGIETHFHVHIAQLLWKNRIAILPSIFPDISNAMADVHWSVVYAKCNSKVNFI